MFSLHLSGRGRSGTIASRTPADWIPCSSYFLFIFFSSLSLLSHDVTVLAIQNMASPRDKKYASRPNPHIFCFLFFFCFQRLDVLILFDWEESQKENELSERPLPRVAIKKKGRTIVQSIWSSTSLSLSKRLGTFPSIISAAQTGPIYEGKDTMMIRSTTMGGQSVYIREKEKLFFFSRAIKRAFAHEAECW